MAFALVHTPTTFAGVGPQSPTIPAAGAGHALVAICNCDGGFTNLGAPWVQLGVGSIGNQFGAWVKPGAGDTSVSFAGIAGADDVCGAILEFSGTDSSTPLDALATPQANGSSSPQLHTDTSALLTPTATLGDLILGIAFLHNLGGGVPTPAATPWDDGAGGATLTNVVNVQTTSAKGITHDCALFVGWAGPITVPNSYRALWTAASSTANDHELVVAALRSPAPPFAPNEFGGLIPR